VVAWRADLSKEVWPHTEYITLVVALSTHELIPDDQKKSNKIFEKKAIEKKGRESIERNLP
jgi:hypothetical protein